MIVAVHLSNNGMAIIAKLNNLQFCSTNRLPQISINAKCGQSISNTMVGSGTLRQMDGDSGAGMAHNH
jgi:hypothetical protein